MDTVVLIVGFLIFIVGGFLVGVLTSPDSKYMLAAWLIASAQAQKEKRAAFKGIDEERRKSQDSVERMLQSNVRIVKVREVQGDE